MEESARYGGRSEGVIGVKVVEFVDFEGEGRESCCSGMDIG